MGNLGNSTTYGIRGKLKRKARNHENFCLYGTELRDGTNKVYVAFVITFLS